MNKADGVTPPVLNPKSLSQYDTLYEVGCCHAADRLVTGLKPYSPDALKWALCAT